ncbi:MAG: class I SAM-dependent methyltransferase [Candidatus Cloacimonetes bacterium]|nr:class I SAM-dependent methyltransferase [Candidatus Cloacimonadota bacterium]
MICPLCERDTDKIVSSEIDKRLYYLCENCLLIFADLQHHLTPKAEAARYKTHNNSINESGYVNFLNRLVKPLLPLLNERMLGLDYGCGPVPTLSLLLKMEGIECEDYDPFFVRRILDKKYDFILSTECFEHFHKPKSELQKISKLLKKGGYLGIMTELYSSLSQFKEWYYVKDHTHVVFYHIKTISFICENYQYELVWHDNHRVFILRKL